MARRFGSAIISNTDSTLFVYSREHIRVNAYTGTGHLLAVKIPCTAEANEIGQAACSYRNCTQLVPLARYL